MKSRSGLRRHVVRLVDVLRAVLSRPKRCFSERPTRSTCFWKFRPGRRRSEECSIWTRPRRSRRLREDVRVALNCRNWIIEWIRTPVRCERSRVTTQTSKVPLRYRCCCSELCPCGWRSVGRRCARHAVRAGRARGRTLPRRPDVRRQRGRAVRTGAVRSRHQSCTLSRGCGGAERRRRSHFGVVGRDHCLITTTRSFLDSVSKAPRLGPRYRYCFLSFL